ncbi:MAG TPA: lactonase family protein [Bryobacteraceae bacterium]|nr:lactonase family protein [Bryobacteraceae bacterium]
MNLTRMLCLLAGAAALAAAADMDYLVYYGTYTGSESKGIYVSRFDARTGKLSQPELAGEVPSPSFIAFNPNGKYLYAASEVNSFDGKRTGAVAAFAIDKTTGKLAHINTVAAGGTGTCFVAVDRSGRVVLAANYGGGSVASFAVREDGGLEAAKSVITHSGKGANPQRQERPHAHSINASADSRFAVAADLGIDKLMVYKLDPAAAALTPNDPPFLATKPGAGPRHFAFHPNGKLAFVINELDSTLSSLSWDAAKGVLAEIRTVTTLPKDFSGESYPAEVAVHPSGKFVYGSNRGHDSIAVFGVDAGGALTPVEHVSTQGKWPRNFSVDPTGTWLIVANERTNNVVVFRIDGKTGKLTPAGASVELSKPVCVRFYKLGK